MKQSIVLAGIAMGVLLSATSARAECSVESGAIVFPVYDVYGTAPLDAVGSLRYKCSSDQQGITTTIRIIFDGAVHGGFARTMKLGADTLKYNLYLDQGRTVVWGDGSDGTRAYVGACCAVGKFATLNVYARIPPGQDVAGGNYADTVLVRLEF